MDGQRDATMWHIGIALASISAIADRTAMLCGPGLWLTKMITTHTINKYLKINKNNNLN